MFHYHFDGQQGASRVLKWGILQAKLFFIPLKKVHGSELNVPLQAADHNLEAITVFVKVFLQHKRKKYLSFYFFNAFRSEIKR